MKQKKAIDFDAALLFSKNMKIKYYMQNKIYLMIFSLFLIFLTILPMIIMKILIKLTYISFLETTFNKIILFITYPIYIIYIANIFILIAFRYYLSMYDSKSISLFDFLSCIPRAFYNIIYSFLELVLSIPEIPSRLFTRKSIRLRFTLTPFFIVDKQYGIIKALTNSYQSINLKDTEIMNAVMPTRDVSLYFLTHIYRQIMPKEVS